jgi:hypothetical protein
MAARPSPEYLAGGAPEYELDTSEVMIVPLPTRQPFMVIATNVPLDRSADLIREG